jgi:hypothetical protein
MCPALRPAYRAALNAVWPDSFSKARRILRNSPTLQQLQELERQLQERAQQERARMEKEFLERVRRSGQH